MNYRDWWRERAPRERVVLATGAALLGLVVLYLLVEPWLKERERMAAELPQLQADLAWMRDSADEIRQLQGGAGTAAGRPFSPALVEEILRDAGLEAQVGELRPLPDNRVRLSFEQVDFGDLMEFLLRLQREGGARVIQANFRRLEGSPGRVEASLGLAPPGA